MLVVTGASGLLGASILLQARDQGRRATGLYNQHVLNIPGIPMFGVDLTNADETQKIFTSLRPTHIIHCAAATDVDWCEEHSARAREINTAASAFLSEHSRKLGAHFIYISTDAVFDGQKSNYSEIDQPAPLNIYAESKLRAEQDILRGDPSALVVRVNIYGWNAQEKLSLAEWIFEQLTAGKQVPGFTDVHFTPILVNDLAEVLLAMLDHKLSGLYHVGGSERVSKFEFARQVASVFGFDSGQILPARIVDARLRARRAQDMSMSTGKISAALARSMPNVDSGLDRFRALYEAGYPQQLKSYLNGARA